MRGVARGALALVLVAPLSAAQLATSFEEVAAGPFTEVVTALGTLSASEGHAQIDPAHAHTGAQCLRLLGGEESAVELALSGGMLDVAEIAFRAERWTSRAPFEFRVEAHTRSGWREVFDGSAEVQVGAHFRSAVRFEIGARIDRLRFSCAAPAGTGVLIDDLELVEPGPATLVRCEVVRPVLPALVGRSANPLARIDFEVRGSEGALELTEVAVDLEGTIDLRNVGDVSLSFGPATLGGRDSSAALAESERFGRPRRAGSGTLVFRGRRELPQGSSHLWITSSIDAEADLDARVGARSPRVRVGREPVVPADTNGDDRTAGSQRLGVALRSEGDDGCAAYRIPGLVTTNDGTLIAVYDARWRGWGDLPGDIDVGMSRSTDGGRTWGDMRLVLDQGGADSERWRGDGVGDPAVLVDRETGSIFVVAVWSHGNRGWHGSGPGLAPEETGQLLMTRSDDDGVTWSVARNLTAMVKDPAWSFLLQGPGRGIAMADGTLVFPAQFQGPPDEGRTPSSTVLVSRDHGESWELGAGAKPNTTESAVVELEDGVLMLNMRDNRGGARSVYTTEDLGATWSVHPTSRQALIEPVCMASLIHVGRELAREADGRLLFSNPNVARAPRRKLSIRASSDFGATWDAGLVLLDEGSSRGYSCLAMIDAETVGILYEGSRAHLTFQRVLLRELFAEGP